MEEMIHVRFFIARRYSYLVPLILELFPNNIMHFTDHRLRPSCKLGKALSPLSIAILSESKSDRQEQSQWLHTIIKPICDVSNQVYILMFSSDPEASSVEYDDLPPNVIMNCLVETVNENYTISQVREKLMGSHGVPIFIKRSSFPKMEPKDGDKHTYFQKQRVEKDTAFLMKALYEEAMRHVYEKKHPGCSSIAAMTSYEEDPSMRLLDSRPDFYKEVNHIFREAFVINSSDHHDDYYRQRDEILGLVRKSFTKTIKERGPDCYNAVYLEFSYDSEKMELAINLSLYSQTKEDIVDETVKGLLERKKTASSEEIGKFIDKQQHVLREFFSEIDGRATYEKIL